nr:sulfatase [Rhodopirellula sp. SWK7]
MHSKRVPANKRVRSVIQAAFIACLSVLCVVSFSLGEATADETRPNVIVILTDDLGYGDLSCYGAEDIATPNIDRMAAEGAKFSSFYVSSVCSPTRASLMTGSHSTRVGIGGVMFPRNNHGLNPDEITLPELLKEQGYATAIIGKWHLGNQDMFQPLNHGLDYWYGTPSSNSQFYYPTIKKYAADCVFREGYTRDGILKRETAAGPLVRDNVVIEVPADQTQFTQRYTRETIRFITQNKGKPFFVYLAHNMPHIPLHASEKFVGSSKRGIYGDTIQELDWSTGEILQSLKELGLDKNTLVIFTSDNGPNTGKGGSAGVLKGGKGSTLEGGVRVPFVARWPGTIPAGTESDEAITGMDLLPTLTRRAGGDVPDDRVIDGKDIWPLLAGKPDAKSPHEAIFYLRGRGVDGIRIGDWKYRTATDKPPKEKRSKRQPTSDPTPKKVNVETLYNLSDDIGEQTNLIDEHPEIARRLKRQLAAFESDLRRNLRPAGVASER